MAQRATYLEPSSFVFFFAFLSLLLTEKSVLPPPKKGHFCSSFCVSLCFSFAFFGLPPFHFLFICLSLSLSLSLSLLFFLPSFLFLMSVSGSCFLFLFCLLFVSRCYFVLFFCLLSCFVLNHIIIDVSFASCVLLVVFCFCCFGVLLVLSFGYLSKSISQTLDIPKNPNMKNAENRTLWQEQLAQVCSQIVSFFFLVFLEILHCLLKTQ